MYKAILPITAAISLAALATPAAFAEEKDYISTISIQGVGDVSAVPDMATVTSGVATDGETARDALTANSEAMAALIDVLKSSGVEDKDIQTSGFSVHPNYVHTDKRDANGYRMPPKIIGYRVSNNVTVAIRDLDSLGGVLDAAVTVGANTINGVNFGVSDTDELMKQARQNAMKDAIEKAELYTSAAGVDLGNIMNISENQSYSPAPMMKMGARMEMADAAMAVPVEAGEMTYSVTVNVQWEIDQAE
ncbi:SIMPL domain-containing protein [Maritalea myrionectae]|uniref:26 kDa periplasmic immunogenic protein n=1 Tax=Maritalea myrionectae TaxID=454601 RepID=A0A2R4MD89_9HYPH|nr:SIMPL domain-containing protein [Maritalea myrionectae]AVX03894.1 26 kDa periplasmic immunogenic protein [Maritalea myrionectae]